MNNEIKINVPEGMEVDKENSTFEYIKFKPKWIPKRGDIAVAGNDHCQIILVGKYIKPSSIIGFNIECLAVMDKYSNTLNIREDFWDNNFWVLEEASSSEKELFINELSKQGYIYDPNDSRVIYKKEKELPKTWEEFCENNLIKRGEVFITSGSDIREISEGSRACVADANLLPSKEYAEAMLALCKLIQLRNCYNGNWEPDWKDYNTKYIIRVYSGNIIADDASNTHRVLAFKTPELRDTFLNNFRFLLEQAKLLL